MRFFSPAIDEHEEVPTADGGQLEELLEHWSVVADSGASGSEAVYVASIARHSDQRVQEAQLSEILSLVEGQGSEIAGHEVIKLRQHNPRTLLGKGKSRELAERARQAGAAMLVLDAELSPSQLRNLEDEAGMSVCDREAVILNVFLRNAKTKQARMQIEIARLEYLRPRIRGVGLNMDQQMGGVKGSRGPGETASELMVRQIDKRLTELRKTHRAMACSANNRHSRRSDCKQIALVGYTNAGKTSLMNALCRESFSAANQAFETLDTVSRCLSRHGGRVLLSDTVGFIRNLPERLLESFESTLSEIVAADVLAIVVDLSDYEWQTHLQTNLEVLDRLAGNGQRVLIFNKCDQTESTPLGAMASYIEMNPHFVSAHNPDSVSALRESLLRLARAKDVQKTIFVPYESEDVLKTVYKSCRVLSSEGTEKGLRLRVEADPASIGKVDQLLCR